MSKQPYYLTGFADEAGAELETQIKATRELGWSHIELRNVKLDDFPSANVHDIPEAAFERLKAVLEENGVRINCFGSAIANGAKSIREPFDTDWVQAKRAVTRMKQLGTRLIRIMSYPVLKDTDDQLEKERFRRLRELQDLFASEGLQCVHENCSNYGGMGWTYTLRLLENVPGLRLVFDTGNPVADADYTRPAPYPRQDSWEFFEKVRPHVEYIHIKDGIWDPAAGHARWCFPGEGQGNVAKILRDLLDGGYQGGISIEPHLPPTHFRYPSAPEAEARYANYVEYGQRLMRLLARG